MVYREYNYSSLVDLVNKQGGNKKVSKELGFDVKEALKKGLDTEGLIALCEKFKVRVKDLVKYEAGSFADVYSQIEDGEDARDKSLLIERVKEEYKKGKSVYRVGKELNVPESTVKAWLVKEGVYKPFERAGRVADETVVERNKAIVEEVKTGVSASVLAEKYNLSLQSIYNIINKNGLELEGKTRLYTDEQKQRALEEYLSGKYTAEQVSKRTGVGIDTVYALKIRGIKNCDERQGKQSALPLDEITRLYKEGVGIRVLGNMFKTSPSNVAKQLKNLGIYEGNRDMPRKNPKKDEVASLAEEGFTPKEICSKLNVSHNFVYTVLREIRGDAPKLRKSDIIKKEWERLSVEADTYKKQKDVLNLLASKFSIERKSVKAMLVKSGVIFIKDLSIQEKKDQIVKLFKEGVTPIEIGSRLDCSKTYVYQVLEENGVERNRKQKEKILPVEEIIMAYKDGLNLNKLARKFNISNLAVREVLVNNGVEIRTRSSMSQEVLDNIISLTGQMMPKEIAEKLGISVTTVYNVQKANGVSKSQKKDG